jgi:hypothetical protein
VNNLIDVFLDGNLKFIYKSIKTVSRHSLFTVRATRGREKRQSKQKLSLINEQGRESMLDDSHI